jgi:2,3-bisphosphoglycerate-dependent phosphoglycerate mutase
MLEPPPRLGRLDVLLVRHAEPIPPGSPGWEERDDDRPLTDAGRLAAEQLADELEPYVITSVYCSPYARAVETVTPTANRRMLEVQLLPDLRERRLTVVVPTHDWADHLERAWANPDYAVEGGESGRQAQRRAMALLDLLRTRHADGGRLLVGSHGNLISLMLQAFEPAVDHAFHLAMPMPAIYHLEHDGIGWRVMGGHGFVQAAPRN